jgi:endonuclease G, mitochondrial
MGLINRFQGLAVATALIALLGCSPAVTQSPTPTTEKPLQPTPIVSTSISPHLLLGNPSSATPTKLTPDNYLMVKNQYALSYNQSKGTANWVAWQLNKTWLGDAERQSDMTLG